MNLWKVNDIYGRFFYFENEKKFLTKLKKCHAEYGLHVYNQHGFMACQVYGYHAVNDDWREVILEKKVIDKVVCLAIERQKKWERNYNERLANIFAGG